MVELFKNKILFSSKNRHISQDNSDIIALNVSRETMKGENKMTEIKWMNRMFGKENKEYEDDAIEKASVLMIPCDTIRPNRAQARASFSEDSLLKLASSIKRYGIIQPLYVRKTDVDDIYDYELVAGERRLRAAKMLGHYCVPCVVNDVNDEELAFISIVENIHREDLNMFELAYGLKNLCDEYGLTQEEVARRMSMSQSSVANKIRLLKLGYEEQKLILELSLSESHARTLLRLNDSGERISLIRRISELSMTVNETEDYINHLILTCDSSKSNPGEYSPTRRSAGAVVRGIQKRLDIFNKSGKNASMNVKSSEDFIELHILIPR